jgi:hypothetical protein
MPSTRARLALAMSAFLLIAVIALCGGYASAKVPGFARTAVGQSSGPTAAEDQYKPGKGCGDKNHQHKPKEGKRPCPPKAGKKSKS